MSSSTKFLNAAQGDTSNESAAQDFLNEKLSKNRFTQKQQNRLDDNGGSKTFGDGYQKVITNQDKIDAFNAKSGNGYADLDVDINSKYKEGKWGSGKHSKEQLAEKFGLDTNAAENQGDTAVWGTNKKGESVFLGNVDNSQRGNSEIIKAHSLQRDSGEADHSSLGEDVSENGDVIGAMLNMWDGGGDAETEKAPEPIEEMQKIEHSPEIKQAKERVRSYEDDALSGKTSADIYSGTPDNKYQLDLNRGAEGIGSNQSASNQATESFLANKKSQIQNKYKFTAAN